LEFPVKIHSKRKQVQRQQKGVTAVEFAVVVPVVLTLVFGIFELTRLRWRSKPTNAAREVAHGDLATATSKLKLICVTIEGVVDNQQDKVRCT
jgi:Flp pilus assembly protein TadG